MTRLSGGPFKEVVVTSSVAVPDDRLFPELTVLSVAPLLGEVIRRIHFGRSVGEMFNE